MAKMPNVPEWIENRSPKVRKQWTGWWNKPWTCPKEPSKAKGFKEALWKHGHLSPNFSRDEARCKDGTKVPAHLAPRAQLHAFCLERVRHDVGDRPIRPLSWYRWGTPGVTGSGYNGSVGGATNSRHLYADATDWTRQSAKFDASIKKHCTGIGLDGGVWVRHADNGPKRTWNY